MSTYIVLHILHVTWPLQQFYKLDVTNPTHGASQVAQVVKNPPNNAVAMGSSLGWEDPLEEEMATYSSILGWKSPRTERPGGLQFMGLHRHDWALTC